MVSNTATLSGADLLAGPFSVRPQRSAAMKVDTSVAANTASIPPHQLAMMNGPADPSQKRSPFLCGYPSKKCWSWRVEKRNGELHKFCEYHRQKANTNQRRMEQRRKQGRPTVRHSSSPACSPRASSSPVMASPAPHQHARHHVSVRTTDLKSMAASCASPMSSSSGSPRGVDHFDEMVAVDAPTYSWMDVDLDIRMDAAAEYMMIDPTIDMEPSDKPVDLYEEDLFFLEHFIDEISRSML